MSNIGYAVFGSPKGISVLSNGLFKELNLDKSLYLNSSHVVLEKGEQVLMIRRIPSSSQNLDKKDALLIVLYENALQYGENRSGGFVGSAICFKNKMQNSEKMVSGLLYLFSKMKENVDADNRFKAIDSSNWNVKLPDTNKEFGMFEESKLNYSSISTTSKNLVVKLHSLEKDAVSLLTNFSLNNSYHSVDFIYASISTKVLNKLKANGFLQIDFSSLFNYDKHLGFYKDRLINAEEKFGSIKKEAVTLKRKIDVETNEVKRLDSQIISRKTELERLDKEINRGNEDLTQVKNNTRNASRELNEAKRLVNNTSNSRNTLSENQNSNKVNELNDIISNAANVLKPNSLKSNESIVKSYFEKLPGNRRKNTIRNISVFSVLLIFLSTFVVLFILEKGDSKDLSKQNKKLNQIISKTNKDIKEEKEKLEEEEIRQLKKIDKSSSTSDPIEFKKLAKKILEKHLKGKTSSLEEKYINKHIWEFWEFDYTNKDLVGKLKPSSKNTFFVTLKNEIKPLNPSLKWQGEGNLDNVLKLYIEDRDDNDIYQKMDPKIFETLKGSEVLEHFKWMIEKENGELDKLKKGSKIKLPFFKK